jgi:hypothetical protein
MLTASLPKCASARKQASLASESATDLAVDS